MRITTHLTFWLASVALVLLPAADAAPTPRPAGMITVPIRSIHGHNRKDLHPQLYLQQHLNRAERRLARMTGRAAPSDDELRARLHKRMYIINGSRIPGGGSALDKRFRRPTAMLEKFRQKVNQLKETGRLKSPQVLAATEAGSTAAGSKAAGSTAADSTATDSTATDSTAADSTGTDSTGADSTAVDSTATDSAATDSTAADSTAADSTAADSTAADTAAADSTAADSTAADTAAAGKAAIGKAAAGKAAAGKAAAGKGAAADPAVNPGVSPVDVQAAESNTLTTANPPAADNSIGLDIEGPDTGYLATLKLGTPPRNFEVLMDSGSADFWVGSEKCKSLAGGGCGNHVFLGKKSSSTFVDTKTQFSVTYGTGQVSGTIVQDNLDLAGLKIQGHVFGTADTESVEFSADTTKFDGLMGLAQSGLSEQQTPTPVEALVAKGLIKEAITSYKISRLADEKNDGEITFGGLDPTKFDKATLVTLNNVNAQGFWEGAMDAITVDGTDAGLQGRTAILDTGTTLIVAPAADATAVHQLITGAKSDGQGGFTVPCTTTQSVALSFGGQSFAIDPRDLAALPVDPNNLTGDCISGITSGNIGGAQEWLVGDVFLKNAYFSTDVQKNTVSLAKLV